MWVRRASVFRGATAGRARAVFAAGLLLLTAHVAFAQDQQQAAKGDAVIINGPVVVRVPVAIGAAPGDPDVPTDPSAPMVTARAPSTQPAPDSAILSHQLADLDDRSPDIRSKARLDLCSLRRDDLPALRAAVDAIKPISPSQASALHEIVEQVFLSGEPYAGGPESVMGIVQPSVVTETDGTVRGITFVARQPGFSAYKSLTDGDVIVSIKQLPDLAMSDPVRFRETIHSIPAGTTLTLNVLRQGRAVEADVVLSRTPSGNISQEEVDRFTAARVAKAEQYWISYFASLAPDSTSAAAN